MERNLLENVRYPFVKGWGDDLRKIVFLFTLHMNLAGRYVGRIPYVPPRSLGGCRTEGMATLKHIVRGCLHGLFLANTWPLPEIDIYVCMHVLECGCLCMRKRKFLMD